MTAEHSTPITHPAARLAFEEAVVRCPETLRHITVLDDEDGSLTAALAAAFPAAELRVLSDHPPVTEQDSSHPADEAYEEQNQWAYADSELVIGLLPKHHSALLERAQRTAAFGSTEVQLILAGRVKHMSPSANAVLEKCFGQVQASRGKYKSRALVGTQPRPATEVTFPEVATLTTQELTGSVQVAAFGGVFAGTQLDIGTRTLINALASLTPEQLPDPVTRILDLGCGNGLLSVAAAQQFPDAEIIATDISFAAVASTARTAALNDLTERITVVHADATAPLPLQQIDLVLCNPPFHNDHTVDAAMAHEIFTAAAQSLRPGGMMLTVFNSHLPHRTALQRSIGPTRQVARTTKFLVVASTKAD